MNFVFLRIGPDQIFEAPDAQRSTVDAHLLQEQTRAISDCAPAKPFCQFVRFAIRPTYRSTYRHFVRRNGQIISKPCR